MSVLSPDHFISTPAPNGHKAEVVATPSLELRNVSAGYGAQPAITNISVSIAPSERIGLIGPNGAGKSTLFRAVVGLLTPLSGEIFVNGDSSRIARRQAAYVPQSEDVDWNFPVAVIDVVLMGLARKIGWIRLANRIHVGMAMEALDRVGMADYAKRQIGELSGGQKRRVFIARALAQGANILLLDEPFTGVDVVAQGTLNEILDKLHGDGVTIVLATHDLSLAATQFDKLLILNKQLIAFGKPADVFKPEVLAKAFGGQLAVFEGNNQIVLLTDNHVS